MGMGMKKVADVLLVEDDPGDVELTREALKTVKMSIALHVVQDGDSALKYLKQHPPYQSAVRPDLILLDLNLPKMSGREVLRAIKGDETLSSIPVIILTTSESDADIAACYYLGANCYITKPLGLEAFIKAVHTIDDFWFSLVKLPPKGKELP
jgi:two-component system, chemotaxis family, response regulator Rcp1